MKQHTRTSDVRVPGKVTGTDRSSLAVKTDTFEDDISSLAQRLYPRNQKKHDAVVTRVREMYTASRVKDFLVIHSPGGWGNTEWAGLLEWEQSIVTGVTATLKNLGYSYIMIQYFRSGNGFGLHIKDIFKEAQFFLAGVSYRADVMSAELKFISRQLPKLKIILVGASQGAAFNNAVMMRLGDTPQVYSLELGTFFPHMKRRQLTDRNLAIDSNGMMPDPMCTRNLWAGFRSYFGACYRWVKYRLQGHPVKFTHLINTPGHEYQWEHPAVNMRITEFLTARFGVKNS